MYSFCNVKLSGLLLVLDQSSDLGYKTYYIISMYIFCMANVQLRLNRHGGCYDSGRSYPDVIRERVLDLAHAGTSQRQIAIEL